MLFALFPPQRPPLARRPQLPSQPAGSARPPRPWRAGLIALLGLVVLAGTVLLVPATSGLATVADGTSARLGGAAPVGAWARLGGAAPVSGPVPLGGPLLGTSGTAVARTPGTPRLPAGVTARGWLLADLATGQVLAAHDAHGRFLPASTLKILTALTLIPRLPAARVVSVSDADVAVPGSKVGLVAHQRYTVGQLLTALLVVSANDAADALASSAGGVPRTVALMSQQAAALQARDTGVRNVTGLDAPGQLTSAYDLALIARAAMKLPAFRHYVAIRSSSVPAPGHRSIAIGNHDKLLWNYPGAIGIKNGYTVAAGGTLVGAAVRGGRTLVVTLLHADARNWPEAAALLSWGFAADGHVPPVGQLVDPVPPGKRVATLVPAAHPARGTAVRAASVARHLHVTPVLLPVAAGLLLAVVAVVGRARRSSRRRLS